MTEWISVGKSRYAGDTYGLEQFLSRFAAYRILDLIELVAREPGCRRMTVNEGRRTRARQRTLRQRYDAYRRGGPWAPLAAVLYTSRHDEVAHGNAADLGGPNGEALNAAERSAISRIGPSIGVTFTGLTFDPAEPWHVEAKETPYTRVAGSGATPIEEDDMTPDQAQQLQYVYDILSKDLPANGNVSLVKQIGGAFRDSAAARNALTLPTRPGEEPRTLASVLEQVDLTASKVYAIVGRTIRRDTKAAVSPPSDRLLLSQADDDMQANTATRLILGKVDELLGILKKK